MRSALRHKLIAKPAEPCDDGKHIEVMDNISVAWGMPNTRKGKWARSYVPCPHPEDPSRDEFTKPWAPGDPQADRNMARPNYGYGVWDGYSLSAPEARLRGTRTFFKHSGMVEIPDGGSAILLSFQVPENREGRVLEMAGQEILGIDLGSDLTWEILFNSSTRPEICAFTGIWSSLERPRKIIMNLPTSSIVSIRCTAPLGPGPRKVQAFVNGLTFPIMFGSGRVSAGWEEV